MSKDKFLFLMIFINLSIANIYIYIYFYNRLNYKLSNLTNSLVIEAIIFLIFNIIILLIIFVVSANFSDKISKFFLKRNLSIGRYVLLILAFMCIVPVMHFISEKIDYREKDLDDVISLNIEEFDYLMINMDHITEKEQHIEELNELLSKYRVKKLKNEEEISDVKEDRNFNITVYIQGKPIIAIIYEDFINFVNDGNIYKVLNGPIDLEWFEKFYNDK
jgi:energy-coupling factor transporter transmembrane protein EcfT